MTVVGAVAARRHPRDHVVAARRRHRQHQHVFRLRLARQPHDHVVGLHRNRLPGVAFARKSPQVLAVIEDLRIGHVIGAVSVGLDQKKIFGIADVRAQIRRHRRHRLEHRREHALPGLDYRVVGIGHVKVGSAGVRVHHHLDRIADVVDAVGVALRVGVVIAGGVAVNDPYHVTVENHGVRVAVDIQERRDVRDAVLDVAPDHDLALGHDILGDEQVDVFEVDAEQQPAAEVRAIGTPPEPA